ncbi:MAG TPA: Ca2+-dependent phosphoinositide-specific phospholipase C [Tahibacter sp.]|nr:Ca2+-dependent phosphoinositide-specific phospholipase C [Tahibacter sp.]
MHSERHARGIVFTLAVAALAAASSVAHAQSCALSGASGATTYQAVFQPTCHNCYEKGVAKAMGANTFKQVLDQVLNVEIDIWDTRDAVTGGKPHEWFVRHNPGSLFQSGNDNNCTGDGKGTNNLTACLNDIKSWSDAHPGHYPVTLFLDKKQAWSPASQGRRPADLDQLATSVLGAKLYKPAELKGAHANLRDAAKAGAWPSRDALKNRVVIALTGGQTGQHNQTLNEYVKDRRDAAALFVAVDTDENKDIEGTPQGFDATTATYLVFYNIKAGGGRVDLGKKTRANGYVSRLWDGDNDNPCTIEQACINDNALKKWNKGACNGLSTGTLTLQ